MCVHPSAAAGTRHYACRSRSAKPGLTSQKRPEATNVLTAPPRLRQTRNEAIHAL